MRKHDEIGPQTKPRLCRVENLMVKVGHVTEAENLPTKESAGGIKRFASNQPKTGHPWASNFCCALHSRSQLAVFFVGKQRFSDENLAVVARFSPRMNSLDVAFPVMPGKRV